VVSAVGGSVWFSDFDCAACVSARRWLVSGLSMFRRCARGSCDFVSFSVDERVRIVEDIGLLQKRIGLFRLKVESLVESLNL
jgi:hypothetical protein